MKPFGQFFEERLNCLIEYEIIKAKYNVALSISKRYSAINAKKQIELFKRLGVMIYERF